MENAPVDWLPPILMLVGGLVVGAIVTFFVSRRSPRNAEAAAATPDAPAPRDLDIRDLEAKRETLVNQLVELENTGAKRDEDQLAVERYELELELARALKKHDELSGAGAAAGVAKSKSAGVEAAAETGPSTVLQPAAAGSSIKGFVWGVLSCAAIAGLLFFVEKSASNRAEGGSVTGGPPMGGGGGGPMQQPQQPQQPDPEVEKLKAAVAAAPDNLETRLELAYQQLMREQLMDVFEQTQYVLQRRPDDKRALTYQSLVRLAMGQGKVAEQQLLKAIQQDPDFLDARVYLALVYAQLGKYDDAHAQVKEAVKRHPADAERLMGIDQEIDKRKAAMGNQPPPEVDDATDPHKGLGMPGAEGSGAPAQMSGMGGGQPAGGAAGDAASVKGTITLAGGVSVPPGTQIFVIVRPAGSQGGGPPSAVVRMTATSFPMQFQISSANSMMGDALPPKMHIEVRADLDGNPMTRDPGAPDGAVDGIAVGSSNVNVTLAAK